MSVPAIPAEMEAHAADSSLVVPDTMDLPMSLSADAQTLGLDQLVKLVS